MRLTFEQTGRNVRATSEAFDLDLSGKREGKIGIAYHFRPGEAGGGVNI